MTRLVLKNLYRRFGKFEAVRDVSLEVEDGEFIVLVGPSGCGKSTTLRMIAGLEEISDGEIRFGETLVNALTPRQRNIAMVFQSYALYPHMSVEENLAFALKQNRMPPDRVKEVVQRTAKILNIGELLHRKPRELSGGQRQRVAMGRAIVREPSIFLFDEPLSNLDAALRTHMRHEIKKLHKLIGTTTIYVTHDQIEALTMADRIVVMDRGEIIQVGDPTTIYESPRTRFVATFIGSPRINLLEGELRAEGDALAVVLDDGTKLALPASRRNSYAASVGKRVELGIRPEAISAGATEKPDSVVVSATVDMIEPIGADTLVVFTLAGAEVTARCAPGAVHQSGEVLPFTIDMAKVHLFDPATGNVIAPN